MGNKKSVTVNYMGRSQEFTEDDIKTIWDPSMTWQEAIKGDPTELYLYKFPSLPTLYINYNGVRLPVSVTLEDFK